MEQHVNDLSHRMTDIEGRCDAPSEHEDPIDDRHLHALLGHAATLLADGESSGTASRLKALGHPIRLRILNAVLHGPRSSAELLTLEGITTTGQLHHHLRVLITANWIAHPRHGQYTIVDAGLVSALLAAMGGVPRSGASSPKTP
ncbi:hypothetical protein AB0J38_11365 [Streptomyces sp. NPDC050095]|uniref:ArsR/SmtB family transcription factor n=1 Tax=unclassified Streptomyces TaxID=2593676 RepID=UPI00341F2FC8